MKKLSEQAARARLRLGEQDQTAAMALALGGLYAAGATIGVFSLVLPHPDAFDDPALWSNVALAYVAGLALILLRGRLPIWAIQVSAFGGTAVITRAVFYGMNPEGFYTYWYLWVGVYAFFFFGRTWGLIHLGVIGAAYGWVLTELPEETPVASWVVTMAGIAVAGVLVDYLARRLRAETLASETRASNLEAVGEVARQLATQSDPRAVGWAICSATVKASGASVAVLWRPDPSGSELVATAAAGADVEQIKLPFVTPGSGGIQAFTAAEARFSATDGDATQELAPKYTSGAALWQPVLRDGPTAVGVLAVYWTDAREGVSDETRRAVRLLALEAAIAIERGELLGRLEVAARTDDLTGLLNRRAWDSELGRELSRANRDDQPLCVAVLDLDHFKQYNDTHGHQAGDRFLKQVAGMWSDALRSHDILARHGGEEFALAMPATDLESAEQMLERLRGMVPEGETCSAGVCLWDGEESAEALIARADAAQYDAKAAGRDRVVGA